MKPKGGYTGNLLRVNLEHRSISKEKIDPSLLEKYIGGRGLNVKFLYDEVKPGIDPLGPENKIFFGVGPCNGTSMSGSQRFSVTAKSPVTGFLGDSNSGGDLGAELKYAGYDMLVIEGKSEKPVYIWINDEQVEIRDATDLWGKTTYDTRLMIEREVHDPDVGLAMIGPAGENQVFFANIISEVGRAAGRSGLGAVLGSKMVKAVAVRGSKGVRVADYKALEKLNRENRKNWRTGLGGKAYETLATLGTTAAWTPNHAAGQGGGHNFRKGTFDKDMLEALKAGRFIAKQKACKTCALGCSHSYVIRSGPYAGAYGEGLGVVHLGSAPLFLIYDLDPLLKFAALTDELGLDFMDTQLIIAFAMECYEKGILSAVETDGLELDWGNVEAVLELTDNIARRKGFGDVLAKGLKYAPKTIGKGSEEYAMHSKGQSMPMRDPRTSKGWALSYATSSRGACHIRGFVPEGYDISGSPLLSGAVWPSDALELVKDYPEPINPRREEGKAELVKFFDEVCAFEDCMEVCRFTLYNGMIDAQNKSFSELLAQFYSAVTGMSFTGQDVQRAGERIINLERAYNLREGLTPSDDTLPKRMLKEPMADGSAKGEVVNLEYMLDRYYELRQWDPITGFPSKEKLLELGLGDIVEDLKL